MYSTVLFVGNKQDGKAGVTSWMEIPPDEFFRFVIPFDFEGSSKVASLLCIRPYNKFWIIKLFFTGYETKKH